MSISLLSQVEPSIADGPVQIVGVAANVKEVGLNEVAFNDVYLPFAQNPRPAMFVVAKTAAKGGSPLSAVLPAVRHEVQQIDRTTRFTISKPWRARFMPSFTERDPA